MVKHNQYPVHLFWAPYGEPCVTIFLGSVVESSLLVKRMRRRGQGGCLIAIDVNKRSPHGESPAVSPSGRFPAPGSCPGAPNSNVKSEVGQESPPVCKNSARNGRVARAAVRLLANDQGMKRIAPLPSTIRCGHLRSAVRAVFPSDLTPVQELSIKTVQKLEKSGCICQKDEIDIQLSRWQEERFQTQIIDYQHLDEFERALRMNVKQGWNLGEYPYVPNGHASLYHDRGHGGNWRVEPFDENCKVAHVFSSGKPRVITMYSSANSKILSPLHDALYASLQREGWLLVGSPTDEKVRRLNGDGPYVSVDYRSATDNIKAEYSRVVIKVLIEKAVGLSDEQIRALNVVGHVRQADPRSIGVDRVPGQDPKFVSEGFDRWWTRGQPMGSLMSFPMLCLINKTVVDLSLADAARSGEISWKEFRVHRCLINGDDLLYRELRSSRGILAGILSHGANVGLVVNEEKTMVHPDWAEVNSTAFYQGVKKKKTNVACLEWSSDVTDPIGYLADSVRRRRNFESLLIKWRVPISKAARKIQQNLPSRWYRSLLKVKEELLLTPSRQQKVANLFPVVPLPEGYDLSRKEETCLINCEVERLQSEGKYLVKYPKEKIPLCKSSLPLRRILEKAPPAEDTLMKVLADGWETKRREKLHAEHDPVSLVRTPAAFCVQCYEGSHSLVACMLATIKSFPVKRPVRGPPDAGEEETPSVLLSVAESAQHEDIERNWD